jgi:hypothetical protein
MRRFLWAASAALLLIGSVPPVLAQTPDPEAEADQKFMTQAEARRKMENNGYSGVTGMKRDTKGNWTASATKYGKKTVVTVTRAGKIAQTK